MQKLTKAAIILLVATSLLTLMPAVRAAVPPEIVQWTVEANNHGAYGRITVTIYYYQSGATKYYVTFTWSLNNPDTNYVQQITLVISYGAILIWDLKTGSFTGGPTRLYNTFATHQSWGWSGQTSGTYQYAATNDQSGHYCVTIFWGFLWSVPYPPSRLLPSNWPATGFYI